MRKGLMKLPNLPIGKDLLGTMKEMVKPLEDVQKVSVRLKVETDKCVHTAHEIKYKNGNTALFTNTKVKK